VEVGEVVRIVEVGVVIAEVAVVVAVVRVVVASLPERILRARSSAPLRRR